MIAGMIVVEGGAPALGSLAPFFAVGGAGGALFLVVVACSVAMRFPAALLAALLPAVERSTCSGGATGLTSTGISPSSSAFPTRLIVSPNRSNTCRRSSLSDLIGDSCGRDRRFCIGPLELEGTEFTSLAPDGTLSSRY
ncbi:hypothetical protein F2Q69_00018696 [Brassica cretica]|uniref:Uncharacterized protein n=1 Tax=Brassica cretica TaxID=69181 RepID=A0A8S9QAM2_BRACR|nr:hypothetical protein F2Q69_00018696 [Brassica cretica]